MRAWRPEWIGPIVVCIAALIPASVLAIDHNESTGGDLSNSGASPTSLTLSAGSNSITASMPGSDLDFLTVHVPTDHQLTALTLVSYTGGGDGTSFIGMKNGTTIAVTSVASQLNGYAHFGTGRGNVGQDILDDIGRGFGATGFTPPLAAGAYSFWIQQQSTANTSYQFDFLVSAIAPPGITGDYNDDDVVDLADYIIWRKNVGAETLPNRDMDNTGLVGDADFLSWRENFDRSAGGAGNAAAVPEATSITLLCCVGFAAWVARRRSC